MEMGIARWRVTVSRRDGSSYEASVSVVEADSELAALALVRGSCGPGCEVVVEPYSSLAEDVLDCLECFKAMSEDRDD